MKTDTKGMYKFWATLRKIGKSRKWSKQNYNGNIRLSYNNSGYYCPLTAVYKELTGETLNNHDTYIVSDALNMSIQNEKRIVDAADTCDRFDTKTYNKLLKTLKLKK